MEYSEKELQDYYNTLEYMYAKLREINNNKKQSSQNQHKLKEDVDSETVKIKDRLENFLQRYDSEKDKESPFE